MNIKIEKIDPNNLEQAKAYCSWIADTDVTNNWFIQKEGVDFEVSYTLENFKNDYSQNEITAFMIKDESEYFGYGSFYINHPVGMHKEGKVCWPSLAIGNAKYRGKGLSKYLFEEIKKLAKEDGCTHIEAGIFEFNEAIKFNLLKMGFEFIGRHENLTFVDGRWWGAEHYLIKL